jgi:hypothetical protein
MTPEYTLSWLPLVSCPLCGTNGRANPFFATVTDHGLFEGQGENSQRVESTDYIRRLKTRNQKDSRRRSDQYANEYFKESKLEIN